MSDAKNETPESSEDDMEGTELNARKRAGPETGAKIMCLLARKAMSADAMASTLSMDPSYIRSVLKGLVTAGILRTWVVPQPRKKSVRLFSWADALSDSEPPARRKS